MKERNEETERQLKELIDFLRAMFGRFYYFAYYDLSSFNGTPGYATDCANPLHPVACNQLVKEFFQNIDAEENTDGNAVFKETPDGYRCGMLLLRSRTGQPGWLLLVSCDESAEVKLLNSLETMLNVSRKAFPIVMPERNRSGEIRSLSDLPEAVKDLIEQNEMEPGGKLSPGDKTIIIQELKKRNAFTFKGAVRVVAQLLNSSVPTIYRILSSLDEEPMHPIDGAYPKENIRLV